ncbi:MAG TPA: transglycosylase SLT domain-containing protein [Acidimicrobiia bacterium]|nr:transglycosylase SLT domain-containing protein [Acidimicrobiia bacterium]
MRFRRLSFIAGWAAVALLAAAGFAAFGTTGGTEAEQGFDAAEPGLGHSTGAQAGFNFALLAGDTVEPASDELTGTTLAETPSEETAEAGASGTIASAESGWLSQVQVRALAAKYFAAEDVNRAVRVAWCESHFNPASTNLRTGAVGLFQHLPRYWEARAESAGFPGAEPTDPEASTAAAAWAVYNEGGWDIFVCRG